MPTALVISLNLDAVALVSTSYLFRLVRRTCFSQYVVLIFMLVRTFLETSAVVCTDFAEVLSLGSAGSSLITFTWKFGCS